MSFAPYLHFHGTARAAMTFHAGVFGATDLQIMGTRDAPPEAGFPPGADWVMHAQFSAGPGAPLMAADLPPGMAAPQGSPTVFHAAPDAARARVIFDRLAEGGRVMMDLAPTFWSPAFGALTDRFGTAWMITLAPQT